MIAVDDKMRQRYALLVQQVGDKLGRPARGWQSATAKKLGVSRSLISKVVQGDLQGIGNGVISRAMSRGFALGSATARGPVKIPGQLERRLAKLEARTKLAREILDRKSVV